MKLVLTVRLTSSIARRPNQKLCNSISLLTRTYSSTPSISTQPSSSSKSIKGESLSASISRRQHLPHFNIPSSDVSLLEKPSHFYQELLDIISRAKRRIFIASLYIGKTETELIQHLRDALTKQSGLQVTIMVDSLRSTREGEYVGTSSTSSCASLLAKLQSEFPDRVQVRLYRAPGLPSWLERLVGKRFVEGWGLQHMKIYGGDDEVMISGANLSNDYFTNRRDRYLRIQDKQFSQYMYTLLMVAARYSYKLEATLAHEPDREKKDVHHSSFQMSWDEGRGLPMTIDAQEHGSKRWKRSMKREIDILTSEWHDERQTASMSSDSIQVVPLLQMGPLGVRQETTCVPLVIQEATSSSARLDFTTGYFSINPKYATLILQGNFTSNMITASPKANGFYGSKGISGHLPAAYTWLESLFWTALKTEKRDKHVTIREWYKPDWTYHAKGIWLYPQGKKSPTHSLLGSSNFGTRSASLDLECTLLIDATQSSSMQKRLAEEVQELGKDANDVVGEAMFNREERKVHWGVKVATWFIKKML